MPYSTVICRWWAELHRAHHRYTDTDRDPYNATKGLFHSHIGWLLLKPTVQPGKVDISDLENNPILQWQERCYWYLSPVVAFAPPALIAKIFLNDIWGGIVYGGFWRLVMSQHVC